MNEIPFTAKVKANPLFIHLLNVFSLFLDFSVYYTFFPCVNISRCFIVSYKPFVNTRAMLIRIIYLWIEQLKVTQIAQPWNIKTKHIWGRCLDLFCIFINSISSTSGSVHTQAQLVLFLVDFQKPRLLLLCWLGLRRSYCHLRSFWCKDNYIS